MNIKINKIIFLLLAGITFIFTACDEEETYEKTRLFRPVLNEDLYSELNTIIINMGKIREATSYTIEVSRDSFRTIDYKLESDTNYIVLNDETLKGDPLFWNTLYQVRATAHAADPAFDSRPSDLGSVRTQRFPSILKVPTSADVIDVAARVTWQVLGAPVTKIKVFSIADLKLTAPLAERDVTASEQTSGIAIVTGLNPATAYQIAIYSGSDGKTLRGWETYRTLEAAVDLTAPNVINLTESEDPDAVINAVTSAADGAIIVVKKGVQYNLPSANLDKSITIRGSYGFGTQKAILFTTGNWNIASGANIDHIRFIDLELRGEDIGGDYVFNPNNSDATNVNELTFDDCVINTFRGIIRIRGKVFIKNYNITNSIVYKIGGYGIFTTDTDGAGNAAFDNIALKNSTFSKINTFMVSRQNAQSIVIDACTLNEVATPNGILFRWRGTKGELSNVLNGITITNTIWGHAWDEAASGNVAVRGIEGLESTSFSVVNTYAPSDFSFASGEIPGFPSLRYSGKAQNLWVDPYNGLNFNFKDTGFAGRFDTGDPRWRVKL